MQAYVYRCYGSADVLQLEEIEKPSAAKDEVVVKVRAAAANPLDWHFMRGTPYLMRLMSGIGKPKEIRLGVDFAGTVESVGANVTGFKPGDAVFGGATGAFGEYVTVSEEKALALKPENVTFEQAAAAPVAALTALQALRDKGQLKTGQKVLINGASGGVGTFAVQIAKSMGAEVTGVCSTRNLEMVRSIGADHVIDYTREDYTENEQSYDLIIDMVGNHGLLENRKVLNPEGRLIMVGGPNELWIGPFIGPIQGLLLSSFVDQEFTMILARLKKEDLETIGDLMQTGEVNPVIDRRFTLNELPDAIRYSEAGRARGKIIVRVE
ncbi:MAG: NAD(P)-dependent alcohol dehydrogenase [Xanthomonadales bacterium]|nr:NAD(P)-dependent alcohol dehydrogenase [Gammaproteobacteria bacterium]MBT8053642.1 NAD(P)-dependent alcohol dehydrogenase [Gammaproteobacteria bacterium]NND57346.1 NAD(P)-dependent alcohol dehydrogenase [Xanthomonadales bacterium]NNK51787.1 NAD(P)-dependent alcohol dehydrogenase [Xanthomonadales bacterium]